MKILVYSHDWAPSVGGIQTVTMTLARKLAGPTGGGKRSTTQVTLVTLTAAGEMGDAQLPFKVVRRPGMVRLIRLLWATELVQLAGPAFVPLALAWLMRKKVVIQHHGYQAVCPDGMFLRMPGRSHCSYQSFERHARECLRCHSQNVGWARGVFHVLLAYPRLWLCRRISANVAVSEHVRMRLGLPNSTTIYNGTETNMNEPPALADATRGQRLFVFVGRLIPEKDVSVLLEAAREIVREGHQFRLRIIGDGPERRRLEMQADLFGLRGRVSFTGYLEGAALTSALQGALAMVIPSGCEEASPLAAIEQMMRGGLLIASDIGGLGELVGDAGLKFAPGDAHALAQCIKRVLDDPELASHLGAAARDRARGLFTEDRMVAEHLKLYRQILATPERPKHSAKLIRSVSFPRRHRRAS